MKLVPFFMDFAGVYNAARILAIFQFLSVFVFFNMGDIGTYLTWAV
jgi:hypothetical protein